MTPGTASAREVDLSQPLSLERAIAIALENHSSLAIARLQVASSQARVVQARSSYFPQITPSYEYRSQHATIAGVTGGSRTMTSDQDTASVALRQLVFDMGKREQNLALSKELVGSSELGVRDTRQTVILNVTVAYYELLRRQELIRVAEATEERARTTLEATRAFAEAGTVPRKDIYQAEADYENARTQVLTARNAVRLAETSLKNAMGIVSASPIATGGRRLDPPPSDPEPRPLAEWVKLALDQRPDLRREESSIRASRHSLKLARLNAGFQVQADAVGGYELDPPPGSTRDFRTFTATFSYPLFDAGGTRARVREAQTALDQGRQQLELARQNALRDVEQSYLQREEARARYQAAEAALRAARVNYDAARESQREGAGTIIDVITAQTQLVTAETNVVQAIHDFYTAEARLLRAIGANDPETDTGRKP